MTRPGPVRPRHRRLRIIVPAAAVAAVAWWLLRADAARVLGGDPGAATRYPDPSDLMAYREADGSLRPVRTPAEWARRRADIALGLEAVMGPLPERWRGLPLEPEEHEAVEAPDLVRRKVSFQAEPGDRVTAYLLVPKEAREGRRPAVLCLHQTTAIGKDEPVGLGGRADLRYAAELAARGYVALAPDCWPLGDYRGKTYDPYAAGYASGAMKGIWNHVRCIDYLASLPEVDAARIGCIGHSLGGHNALWLGVFEPRIRAFVTSCGFNSFAAYAASPYGGGDLRNYAQRGYMPRVAAEYGNDPARVPFEFHEVLGALAPRPVFVSAPLGDENFVVSGVRDCVAAARPVYALLGRPGSLVAVHPAGGHEFPAETRRAAYDFIDRELAAQGRRFPKRRYDPAPLPAFETTRARLPSPVFDEDPRYVACWWKAWELAFRNFHAPSEGSGYVSRFIDAAFNQNIFLWDTCFMTMFCSPAGTEIPGIESLDNFYAKQHESGEISREIDRATGRDFGPWTNIEGESLFSRWGWAFETGARKSAVTYAGREPPFPAPELTLDAMNHPILAWAELESWRWTGDAERLRNVRESLVAYHAAYERYLRQGNGLYMTDWASMDNSPRNRWLEGGGAAVDTSSEMALFARNLAEISEALGSPAEAEEWRRKADDLARRIDEAMWDPAERFYVDLALDGARVPVKTVAGFWTLLAGVAKGDRARALVEHLRNPRTFGTAHRVPTLAADEEGFDGETGSYWRGAVWAPTTAMVVRGLETVGEAELAREIALEHLRIVVDVFEATGTIWENYSPLRTAPGRPAKGDFVGWSGIAPILFLLRHAIGIEPDVPHGRIVWTIRSPRRVGVEGLRLGGNVVSLVCEESGAAGRRTIRASASAPVEVEVRLGDRVRSLEVPAGTVVEVGL